MYTSGRLVKLFAFSLHKEPTKFLNFETITDLLIKNKILLDQIKIKTIEVEVIATKERPDGGVSYLGKCKGMLYDNQFKKYSVTTQNDGTYFNEYDHIWIDEEGMEYWAHDYIKLRFIEDCRLSFLSGKLKTTILHGNGRKRGSRI